MSRESVDEKARRYLGEGRLVVRRVVGDEILATCRGGGAVYELGFEAGGWWCSCPATRRCAHLAALERVTAVTELEVEEEPGPDFTEPGPDYRDGPAAPVTGRKRRPRAGFSQRGPDDPWPDGFF